ncbi:hypothetical protein [Mucilaginibacter celer]|uniref:Uncharacterized protein n=1 Tax=Mucilaginibacter celer TaxID=2305508 RepID=A0A494VYF6_9SPHI|nr:hypothetical protein [Mucilaginibacter celer]AYL96195.1 hypothetical protein HYN43_013230 [Mucilaginibacter celer]
MKTTPTKLKYIFILITACISSFAYGQVRFKQGDEFQRQVIAKSNCVLQRGGQTLNVSSVSIATKLYKVTDASDRGASVTISTDKLIDTINAMNQVMVYHSGRPVDPNSIIQAGLQKLFNAQASVSVNNKGEIVAVKRPAMANDTLLSFAGIQPENLSAGSTLPFMVNFPVNPSLKKGYTWKTSTSSAEINYTIYAANSLTTTITYKVSVLGGSLNSRINGTMLIDNNTGMVLKRYSQSVSTGYEMVNGIVYTATRRTAVTEICNKK